jgi:hypothetical protein
MSMNDQSVDRGTSELTRYSHEPNIPEVSGTSFPLLTTVLAGFAVTIAVQLIIRPDTSEELPFRIVAAIAAFLASTLFFISSIIFAVNAQTQNYLPFLQLDESGRRLLGIQDYQHWLDSLVRRWELLHLLAIATFFGGIALLLTGVNLIVWVFVGNGMALLFLGFILFNLLMTILADIYIKRMGKAQSTVERASQTGAEPAVRDSGTV